MLTTAKLDATGQRLIACLSDFNLKIKYMSDSKNTDADGLLKRQEFETEESMIFPHVILAVSMLVTVAGPLTVFMSLMLRSQLS